MRHHSYFRRNKGGRSHEIGCRNGWWQDQRSWYNAGAGDKLTIQIAFDPTALPDECVVIGPENYLLCCLEFIVNEQVLHACCIQNGCMNIGGCIERWRSFKLPHNPRKQ